jgi:hypothetical protein
MKIELSNDINNLIFEFLIDCEHKSTKKIIKNLIKSNNGSDLYYWMKAYETINNNIQKKTRRKKPSTECKMLKYFIYKKSINDIGRDTCPCSGCKNFIKTL